jgi:DNA-binding LacI/PurR family transcriptional regulator
MRRYGASERAVRWALEELQRTGKIISRQGARTIVADRPPAGTTSVVPRLDQGTIVAVGEPDQAFFDRAMHLLLRESERADLSLVCRLIKAERHAKLAPPAPDERPLGFILFRYDFFPLARQLQAAGNRVVLVGAPPADAHFDVPNVYGDHEQGGYLTLRHLLELGHERIAFCGTRDIRQTLRWAGFQRVLQEAARQGKTIHTSVLFVDEVREWARNPELAKAYFARPDAPTGMVAWNDHEALLVGGQLNRIGIRIPEDVSIVGYDDLPEGRMMHPPLTTVDSGVEQQLQAAINVLLRPTPASPTHTVVIIPSLLRRESTAPPRQP